GRGSSEATVERQRDRTGRRVSTCSTQCLRSRGLRWVAELTRVSDTSRYDRSVKSRAVAARNPSGGFPSGVMRDTNDMMEDALSEVRNNRRYVHKSARAPRGSLD
ncbi:hypothetical protein ALC62_09705, partial [Cyphomyrmex costatus]